MSSAQPVRVRVRFAKDGDLRFTGHLDLQRLFERALRRSGLPLRYSQGFNPKVRLNLASALPLGFSSRAELLDFRLNGELDTAVVEQKLKSALPKDITVLNVAFVSNQLPSLQSSLKASEYRISFLPEIDIPETARKLAVLLSQEVIPIHRRAKSVDLKQLMLSAEWTPGPGAPELCLKMKSTPEANGRPDELLNLLGLAPGTYQVCRTALFFNSEEVGENG